MDLIGIMQRKGKGSVDPGKSMAELANDRTADDRTADDRTNLPIRT
jgi:hypothetical protein